MQAYHCPNQPIKPSTHNNQTTTRTVLSKIKIKSYGVQKTFSHKKIAERKELRKKLNLGNEWQIFVTHHFQSADRHDTLTLDQTSAQGLHSTANTTALHTLIQ